MSNRIPFLKQYINTSNNTNFNNTYTSGSGVGAKSISNRRALVRRSSLNAGTLTDPKKGKCSGFCTAWGLQPMHGFNFLPIPPKPIPESYSFQMYYIFWTGTTSLSQTNEINDILASSSPTLLTLPRITYQQAVIFLNEFRLVGKCPSLLCIAKKFATIIPQKSIQYWINVINNFIDYMSASEQADDGNFAFGVAPVTLKITQDLYGGSQIPYDSNLFNLMFHNNGDRDKLLSETIIGPHTTADTSILLNIFNPNQKNIISSTFNPPVIQSYYVWFCNLNPIITSEQVINILMDTNPTLESLPRITLDQVQSMQATENISHRPVDAEEAYSIIPEYSLEYWNAVYAAAGLYGYNVLHSVAYPKNVSSQFDIGFGPIESVIYDNLYGNEITYGSYVFNNMVYPVSPSPADAAAEAKKANPQQKLLVAIYNPNQKNLIISTFDPPNP